ncbi:hypothetical protein PQO01_05325 [Lentisphaera marina]|uniref:hypothetical protein n=1 Tax=Lentisphaera marina TaxID=1111041 RepID=UPI0023662181|nr:hypothetical protein [Lentisphaera marina]MDD7984367.1 hypothetical protein [Lentisphaera marina]
MKKFIFALLITLIATSCAFNDREVKKSSPRASQTHCPISGDKVDEWAYTDYKQHRIYFCCLDCETKFLGTPEKYLMDMKGKGIAPAKIQTQCPVSDEAVTTGNDFYKSTEGEVAVCCKKCLKKITKNPIPYLMKLKRNGVTIGAIKHETTAPHACKAHSQDDHSGHDH